MYMKVNSEKFKKVSRLLLTVSLAMGLFACEDDTQTDSFSTKDVPELLELSQAQKDVLAYLPTNIIIAHRGTEFWAPEESEAAMRWARNMGADYIECDLQKTADGVILALHDESLLRTTNVETIYPNRENDYVSSFTYDELLKLDIGSWFNEANPEQARESFVGLDILTLDDVLMIAEGKRIKRNPDGTRVVERDENGNYLRTVYEDDPADNGNRPGVYIETKSPSLFPNMEEALRACLEEHGWYAENINDLKTIAYKDGQPGEVDIANTPARIILQTFEPTGLVRMREVFTPPIPTLSLFGDSAGPASYARYINFAIENGATIMGPNIDYIEGYPSSIEPWQRDMIRKTGMHIHCWSFNTQEQYMEYCGPWQDSAGQGGPEFNAVDGGFTNRTDLALRFYKETLQGYADQGRNYFRSNAHVGMPDNIHAAKTMRIPQDVLEELGY